MLYAVMYKIDASKKDYSGLYDKIKSLGLWMHYLDSSWLVYTDDKKTAKEVYDALIPFIAGETDYLLVFEVKNNWWGWLPTDAIKWIRERGF
jgi:hypothetical protein